MTAVVQASRRRVADVCPLCGAADAVVHVDHGDGGTQWKRCRCGVVFKSEDVAPGRREALGDAGDGHYDAAYFGRYARRRRRRVRKARRQIRDAVEVAPAGRLLDVGCSLGYTLDAARSLGIEATGVDLSQAALSDCVRRDLDVRRGELTELPFGDGRFAIVILKHVFEHTPEPRAAAAEIRRVLAPGGAAFFALPNLDYRRARDAGRSRFFRGEAGSAHFVYWTPATLSRLLEEQGLRVASVHARLLHRRAPLPLRLLELLLLPLRVPLRAIADAAGLRKEFWLVARKMGSDPD